MATISGGNEEEVFLEEVVEVMAFSGKAKNRVKREKARLRKEKGKAGKNKEEGGEGESKGDVVQKKEKFKPNVAVQRNGLNGEAEVGPAVEEQGIVFLDED